MLLNFYLPRVLSFHLLFKGDLKLNNEKNKIKIKKNSNNFFVVVHAIILKG